MRVPGPAGLCYCPFASCHGVLGHGREPTGVFSAGSLIIKHPLGRGSLRAFRGPGGHTYDRAAGAENTRLRVFLRRLLINDQSAEDVMQDTFTEIWRQRRDTIRSAGACERVFSEWRVNRRWSGGVNSIRKRSS